MPLGKNADAGDYVKDFEKSDAPQFKGKSKEKRRKMAIAAYLDSKDKKESKMKSFDDIKAEVKEAEEVKPHKMYDPETGKSVMAKDKADHDKYTKMGYTHEKPEVKEISSNKLGNYMRKSSQSAAKPGQSARTQDKRIAGQSMADKKIRKKMGYSSTAKVPAGKNESVDEGIIGNLVKKTAKKVGGAVTNRLTTTGRAKIAQKKIDKHNTKIQQKDTIAKANAAGKSAFGLTQKSRAANAKKKLDKIAKKKAAQDTIARAKQLRKGVTAGMEYEGKKMDSAAMKKAMDVFKKRGGKIKKIAPGKAAGYHGKDDPGKGVQGMMDRGDTKGFNRKKKVKSMR